MAPIPMPTAQTSSESFVNGGTNVGTAFAAGAVTAFGVWGFIQLTKIVLVPFTGGHLS